MSTKLKILESLKGQNKVFVLKNGKRINVFIDEIYNNSKTVKCLIGKTLNEFKKAQKNDLPADVILKNRTNYILLDIEDISDIS